jgi:UDP-N-acetylmuramoyl-tripeptide--D-alanyl-D-alanine ligase
VTENTDTAQFTAAEIARACGGEIIAGSPETCAAGVSTDTRALRPGEAFFALVGPRHDGHAYLRRAAQAGASVLVVHHRDDALPRTPGPAVVRVPETERALLALAAGHRRRLDAQVVAVTGSCGKSTVKSMIGAILARAGRCTVAPASFNNRIGVARTLLSAGRGDDFVVLEMGTNHPGEIDELARAARPALGVITAVAPAHLEGLGDLAGVREAKAELIPHLPPVGTLVLNADDPVCAPLAARHPGTVRTFGLSPGADVRCRRLRPAGRGWAFDALGRTFRLSAGGRYNVLNAAAALCASARLGVTAQSALGPLAEFRPPPMRYEKVDLGGVLFILDCYNSNPAAMRAALQSFLCEQNPGRKVVVCGDMLELGEAGLALHREVGRELGGSPVDVLVTVGRRARNVLRAWRRTGRPARTAMHFGSAQEAWQPLWRRLRRGDAVLVKGSRAMRLETITRKIAEHLRTLARSTAA